MNSKISVIIPVYNVEKYIEKCLDSVISQTYKNIEIIIINDGTLDTSLEIAEKYAKIDNRIIILTKTNGGLSSARNFGLNYVSGDYIVFIDSDDWIEKNMLEKLIKTAHETDGDIIQFGFRTVLENGREIKKYTFKEESFNSRKDILDGYFINEKINTVVWNKLYKKYIFNKIRMIEGRNNEDTMVMPEILNSVNKFINMSDCFYNYVQRDNTIMSSKFSEKKLDQIYACNHVIDYCGNICPEYIDYAKIQSCLNSILLYRDVLKGDKINKNKYKKIIRNEFLAKYNSISNDVVFKKLNKKRKLLIKLFMLSPITCVILVDCYDFIKVWRLNG